MKFIIHSSSGGRHIKPCQEATKEMISGKEVYIIEIKSLSQLMTLARLEGALIVEAERNKHALPEIEIYDTWRE